MGLLKITWSWAVPGQKAGVSGLLWAGLCGWWELTGQGCSSCCPLPAAPCCSGNLLGVLAGIVSYQISQLNWHFLITRLHERRGIGAGGAGGAGQRCPCSLWEHLCQTLSWSRQLFAVKTPPAKWSFGGPNSLLLLRYLRADWTRSQFLFWLQRFSHTSHLLRAVICHLTVRQDKSQVFY